MNLADIEVGQRYLIRYTPTGCRTNVSSVARCTGKYAESAEFYIPERHVITIRDKQIRSRVKTIKTK